MEFQNRTAIITGAASGMGLLTAQRLWEQGANVLATDVNGQAAEEAIRAFAKDSERIKALGVDVRDFAQVQNAAAMAVSRFGSIDILVNCAGGASSRVMGRSETFKDMPIEVIDWGIDVNLKGPLYFARAVIGQMIAQERGVIVNIGSIDGETGSLCIDYGTAKSGMYGLTKSLALYGAPHGVRSVCVSPGPVLTRPAMARMRTPLGRAAEPEEVVSLILYLASDQAAFITGSNHLIDGGRSCGAQN